MDRFIGLPRAGLAIIYCDLKSNMDRFIGNGFFLEIRTDEFKIQYG